MLTRSKRLNYFLGFQKYIGILLILIGLPMFILNIQHDKTLLLGLFILFTAFEKKEDERSISLKMSSLYISFILSYVIKTCCSNFHLPVQLIEADHFILLVFALSLIIYYSRSYTPQHD